MSAGSNRVPNVDPVASSPMIHIGRFTIRASLLCVAWGVMIVAGLAVTLDFDWRPAAAGTVPVQWPQSVALAAPATRPVLLMFLHPHCPCSRASVDELEHLMVKAQGQVSARVLFFDSSEFVHPAEESALWNRARTIPGVHVETDPDGLLARRFGANASGTVLFYDSTGRLQFAGGITAGRGHGGDNAGVVALTAAIHGQRLGRLNHPVFGCSIKSEPEGGQCLLR